MASGNNKRSVRRQVTVIHPTTPVPDGVDELVYDSFELDPFLGMEYNYNEYLDDNVTNEPDSPISISVLSQELRTKKNGEQVVDVVFRVRGIEGALNYEIRYTRLGAV